MCFCLELLTETMFSAVKHCPSPFFDHFSPSSHTLPSSFLPLVHPPPSIHCQEGQLPKSHFNSARHRQRLVEPAASKVSESHCPGQWVCMARGLVRPGGFWGLVDASAFIAFGTWARGRGKAALLVQGHVHQWYSSKHLQPCFSGLAGFCSVLTLG